MDLSSEFCAVRAVATDEGVTIRVEGEVDLASAPLLYAAFESVDGHVVEVDLSEMTFCDAAGLRLLHQLHARLGARMRVTGASELLCRLAEVLGMDWLAAAGPGEPPVR
jgi:anti-anti-sigma factor